ncbi:MAG: hypothetical protein WC385_00600 [Candidatus Paceibacterota bacterium]|jgi:hypothetical protein
MKIFFRRVVGILISLAITSLGGFFLWLFSSDLYSGRADPGIAGPGAFGGLCLMAIFGGIALSFVKDIACDLHRFFAKM